MNKRQVAHKVSETTGATILMALLALLVVAMVSAVILAAATSTVRQSKADQESQQTLLDLQMAGELTAKELSSNFSVTVVSTSDDGSTWSDPTITSTDGVAYTKAVKSAVKEIYYSDQAVPPATSLPKAFFVETTYGKATDANRIQRAVKVSFVLLKNEDIQDANSLVFTFTPPSGEKGGRLYLRLSGKVKTETVSDTVGEGTDAKTTYTRTETYAWDSPSFSTSYEDVVDDGK